MSRSMIRNLLLSSAVALASAQIDSLANMDLTTAEAVPTTCTAAQMSSIYNTCLNQCEPAPANAIIACDDVQTRFQIVKCAALTEQCNGQPESGVVRQAQGNRLKEVCTNADSFRMSDVTLMFATAADVANSLTAQSQIEQLTLNAQALNNVNATGLPAMPINGMPGSGLSGMPGSSLPGMPGDLPLRSKRGIKYPAGPRKQTGVRGSGGLYGTDVPSADDVLGPLPTDIDMILPPMIGPGAGRPKKGVFPNNGTGIPGTNGVIPIDIIGVNGPGGINIDIIDDTTGLEITSTPFNGVGPRKTIGGGSPNSPRSPRKGFGVPPQSPRKGAGVPPRSPRKSAGVPPRSPRKGLGIPSKDLDLTYDIDSGNSTGVNNGKDIIDVKNGKDNISVGNGNGKPGFGKPGFGKPGVGIEIGVGSGNGVDTYQVDVNGKGWSKGVGSPKKGNGQDIGSGFDAGKGFGSGSGSGFGIGSGQGVGTGSGQGVGVGSGSGVGTGSGQGVGTGSGQGVGTGSGQGVGPGSGQGFGSGVGSGSGSGVGTGSGQGVGSGSGQGFGSGSGIGSGSVSGVGSGFGSGIGSGTGQGVGQGVGSGVGSGSGAGSGSGHGSGSGSPSIRKSTGAGDGKESGSGKGAGVKEYTWKQTGGKKGESSSSSSTSSVGAPAMSTMGNGTGAKGYNTTKFHTTNSTSSKPNSVAKLAAPALSAVVVCALTAFFSF